MEKHQRGETMKIKIEPQRFKSLLAALMIGKGRIDPIHLDFDANSVESQGIYSNTLGVSAKIDKSFFLEYESKKETIAIPSKFVERLGWGFSDEEIAVHTKGTDIFVKGSKDSYDTTTETPAKKPLPWGFVVRDDGLFPDYNFDQKDRLSEKDKPGSGKWKPGVYNVKSSFRVDVKELKLPSASEYLFEYIDGELKVKIVDGGNWCSTIRGTPVEKGDVKFPIDGEFFKEIVNHLDGEILLVFDEKMTTFIDKKPHCMKTYFLANNV